MSVQVTYTPTGAPASDVLVQRRRPSNRWEKITNPVGTFYPDGNNDAARLKDDGMLKLLCDRDPGSTDTLGSQPTLSRFENAMRARALLRFGQAYARSVLGYQHQQRCGTIHMSFVEICGLYSLTT